MYEIGAYGCAVADEADGLVFGAVNVYDGVKRLSNGIVMIVQHALFKAR